MGHGVCWFGMKRIGAISVKVTSNKTTLFENTSKATKNLGRIIETSQENKERLFPVSIPSLSKNFHHLVF